MNFLKIPAVFALLATASAAACTDATTTPAGDDGGTAAGPDGSTGATDGGAATDAGSTSASLTWTAGTITGADAEKVGAFHAMAFGAGRFVAFAVAHTPAVDNNVFALTSTDGKTWTVSQKFGPLQDMAAVTYYGSAFLAVGRGPDGAGGTKTRYATSADGSAWTFTDGPGKGANAVAASAARAVWGGEEGLTTTFVTGQTPVHRSAAPLSITVQALCSVGTRYIAGGPILPSLPKTSPFLLFTDDPSNGLAWSAAKEPEVISRGSVFIRGLYCDDQIQVAVGAGKDVFVSTDRGGAWVSAVKDGDSTTWTRVQKASGKLVLVGWKGAYGVMTNASDLAVGKMGAERDFGVAASNGTIVVAGSDGSFNDGARGVTYWTAP